ncbi:hypothetical protein M9H77_02568 [Catharanthus roseus]|uniref:Uncharacterized protein n=1 Tax=Catharanthus roseus TaxID=4058 RepID=A0ACC0C995_CATRO|nr:hypothetical protein M9H77_02568 [Catharanthus roseus]
MTRDAQGTVEPLQGPVTRVITSRMEEEHQEKIAIFKGIIQDLTWVPAKKRLEAFELPCTSRNFLNLQFKSPSDVNWLDMQEHQGIVTTDKAKQLNSHKDQIEQEQFQGINFDVQDFMGQYAKVLNKLEIGNLP